MIINPYRFAGGGVPTSGLIAEYLFDTDGEDTANNYDLTLNSGASVSGGNLVLDGVDDSATRTDNPAFSFTDGANNDEPFSVSCWVNFDTSSANGRFVSKYAGANEEWLLGTDGNGYLTLFLKDVSANILIGRKDATTLSTATWYHCVSTYNGDNSSQANAIAGISIYLDGTQVDDTNYQSGTGYVGMEDTSAVLGVGTGAGGFLDGKMDNVRIYDRELSSVEVTSLFQEGHS